MIYSVSCQSSLYVPCLCSRSDDYVARVRVIGLHQDGVGGELIHLPLQVERHGHLGSGNLFHFPPDLLYRVALSVEEGRDEDLSGGGDGEVRLVLVVHYLHSIVQYNTVQ